MHFEMSKVCLIKENFGLFQEKIEDKEKVTLNAASAPPNNGCVIWLTNLI